MRTERLRQIDLREKTIRIGFEGENEFTQVRINCKETFDQHPEAIPAMVVTDPAGNRYPAIVSREGNEVVWTVTAADLTKEGAGEIQLAFTVDGTKIGKTYVAKTRINRSITPSGEAPEPISDFVLRASELVDRIPQDIDSALQQAKDSGEFDGFSPTIQITPIPGGHHVVITDASGGHSYDVLDGADGATYTPAVSEAGVLSWTNDGGRQNPPSVDIAGAVRGVIDETVQGTTPSITGQANHRYLCGEVATITITPPQTGIIDVIFTSGTTPAILTVPNTVRFPEWFDPSDLESETTYEINIVDGTYGAVMAWT